MVILVVALMVIAWVGVPGALIGWIAGFFDWQIYAAIAWAAFIFYTFQRSRRKEAGRVDLLTYFLAFVQASIGGAIAFVVGHFTH